MSQSKQITMTDATYYSYPTGEPYATVSNGAGRDADASEDSMSNVGIALGLVILAGGATSVGAAVVYIPSLVNLANSKTLAISLGLSAGVMLFVSFVEIFTKSQESFEKAGHDPDKAFALAIVAFFAGTALMMVSHCDTRKAVMLLWCSDDIVAKVCSFPQMRTNTWDFIIFRSFLNG